MTLLEAVQRETLCLLGVRRPEQTENVDWTNRVILGQFAMRTLQHILTRETDPDIRELLDEIEALPALSVLTDRIRRFLWWHIVFSPTTRPEVTVTEAHARSAVTTYLSQTIPGLVPTVLLPAGLYLQSEWLYNREARHLRAQMSQGIFAARVMSRDITDAGHPANTQSEAESAQSTEPQTASGSSSRRYRRLYHHNEDD